MIGVGMTRLTDSRRAGQQAACRAQAALRSPQPPLWGLIFVAGRHDPHAVLAGAYDALGPVPLYGGACVGTITHEELGYSGFEVAVALFAEGYSEPVIVTIDHLSGNEADAGRRLAEALHARAEPGDNVLLLYDLVRDGGGVNVGSRLLDALHEALGADGRLTLFGGGLLGDFDLATSHIVIEGRALKDRVLAIILPRELDVELRVMHGCTPVTHFLEITRVDGPRVLELEGRRATDVIADILRIDRGRPEVVLPFSVLLGRKAGDPWAPYDETCYINRLIIGADYEQGSVTLFEADFQPGDRVQLMVRDHGFMFDSVRTGVGDLLQRTERKPRRLAFYVDCAGRAAVVSATEAEEAALVQSLLPAHLPLMGFYGGREVAPFLGRSRPLDWTGVLAILSERTPR
ncbi:MAG TPA: FIST N-terminal domain-containing protein [Gammaproteobacteria bacterium]|nr:FIST N-terminal domain-containing protein [Gammaproteobacteria bacterium]